MKKFTKTIAEQKLNKRVGTDIAPQQKTLPGLDNPRSLIMALFQAELTVVYVPLTRETVAAWLESLDLMLDILEAHYDDNRISNNVGNQTS